MMDSLNGNNIQCFSVPLDIDEKTLKIKYRTTRRKFDFEQPLPYQSCHYDYSDNFIIFDYERSKKEIDAAWIYLIENGKLTYHIPPTALSNSYPIVLVINKYGIPLNVKCIFDFYRLKQDYDYFNKTINSLQNEQNKDELIKLETAKFQYKWYNFELLDKVNSNIIGVLLAIYAINKNFKIKEIFKAYCEKHNLNPLEEIEDYQKWAALRNLEIKNVELEEVLL